jgi:dihydrofolate reductase
MGAAAMGDVVAFESVTLDGVMQGPGRPDEDRRGGFEHGGWAAPYADEQSARLASEGMGSTRGLLLGRRTYEDFYGFWPKQGDNPFTEILDRTTKYVTSRTLKDPLPWQNSTLLDGDASVSVARLKRDLDGDLVTLGSGELVRSLLRDDLVDRFILLIHPLVLGAGRRLFDDGDAPVKFGLADTRTTSTGVLVATYRRKAD